MIDWLTKQISKSESLDNNKEVKQSKQQEQSLGRENAHDYISASMPYLFLPSHITIDINCSY